MAVWRVWIGAATIVVAGCAGESSSDDENAVQPDDSATVDDAESTTATTSAPTTTSSTTSTSTSTTSTSTTSTSTTSTTVAPTVPPNLPIGFTELPLAPRDCFTGVVGPIAVVDCGELHDGQVFALDVALTDVAPDEPDPAVWTAAATAQCVVAFQEFTGGAVENSSFTIAAVLTAPGTPPVVACAAVTADASQWAGTAEQIIGAYDGIDVGECFNFPTQDSDAEEVSCDQPHEAEMFLVRAPIGIDDPLAPYPTEPEWEEIAVRLCDPAFTAYTGQPVGTGAVGYTYVFPLESGWLIPSERTMSCAAVNFDGTMLAASVRA